MHESCTKYAFQDFIKLEFLNLIQKGTYFRLCYAGEEFITYTTAGAFGAKLSRVCISQMQVALQCFCFTFVVKPVRSLGRGTHTDLEIKSFYSNQRPFAAPVVFTAGESTSSVVRQHPVAINCPALFTFR